VTDEIWTVGRTLVWLKEKFASVGITSARLDAELLVGAALGLTRVQLFVQQDRPLTEDERAPLRGLARRRLAREPVAYILGRKGFLDVDLAVGPGVLVPRPETEFVIDVANELADRLPPGPVADLGSGSGAIAVGLSRRLGRPVVAVERSAAAAPYARRNLTEFAATPFVILRADWAEALADRSLALVATNPPYVSTAERKDLAPELAHEPAEALFAAADGLADLERLAQTLPRVLIDGGWWVAEVGAGQRAAVESMLAAAGWAPPLWQRDYAGHDRVLATRRP
jgi:release factor glutamine methyltransferase